MDIREYIRRLNEHNRSAIENEADFKVEDMV